MDQSVSGARPRILSANGLRRIGMLCAGALGGCVETGALSAPKRPSLTPDWLRARPASAPTASALPSPVSAAFRGRWKSNEETLSPRRPANGISHWPIRESGLSHPRLCVDLPHRDRNDRRAVYDVFDASKKRAQRLEDDILVKSDGADPGRVSTRLR